MHLSSDEDSIALFHYIADLCGGMVQEADCNSTWIEHQDSIDGNLGWLLKHAQVNGSFRNLRNSDDQLKAFIEFMINYNTKLK